MTRGGDEDREREIREEIGFHLEMRARELERRGLAPGAARRAAEERFGGVEKTVGECLRASGEERLMLQKVNLALLGVLIALTGFLAWTTGGPRGVSAGEIEGLKAEVRSLREALAAPAAPALDPDRAVVLSGQVARPGAVAWREGLTLSLALAERGGLGNFARASEIRILRRSDEGASPARIPVDYQSVLAGERSDPELRPGDIIEVPEALF